MGTMTKESATGKKLEQLIRRVQVCISGSQEPSGDLLIRAASAGAPKLPGRWQLNQILFYWMNLLPGLILLPLKRSRQWLRN